MRQVVLSSHETKTRAPNKGSISSCSNECLVLGINDGKDLDQGQFLRRTKFTKTKYPQTQKSVISTRTSELTIKGSKPLIGVMKEECMEYERFMGR